jgi:cytochrome b561
MLPPKLPVAKRKFMPPWQICLKMDLSYSANFTHDARMTQAKTRYSTTAMLLHWAIALLLVANFALGERTEDLPRGPELAWVMGLHKSIGITILLLTLWRLGLRFVRPRPAKAADSPVLQLASTAVHWGFYAVMLIVPLSGWLLVSTSRTPMPIMVFDLFAWPLLPNFGHDVHEVGETVHAILAKAMIPLLALHLIGAARHQFLLRDALVERMVPVKRVSLLGFVLLIASLAGAFAVATSWPAPGTVAAGEPLPDFKTAQASSPAMS